MNEPTYTQVKPSSCFSEKLWGKWYCVCFEYVDNEPFARYLHPTGWKTYCHYFDEEWQARLAFVNSGQTNIPVVSVQEIEDRELMKADMGYDIIP
jgi:hypothetical protein